MDRNNRIWSGKRIVSLCLILCLTFSSCLTYVSGTSAYAAEAVESNASGAADGTGDTEQTADVGTEDAGQNIQAGATGDDSTASNGSATDGSIDGKDTGAGTDADNAGGSASDNGNGDASDSTDAAMGAEESALPANVLRADNELQRGEQLKAQMQLQLQVGLRSGALRTALLTKAGEAGEVEVSTPVAAELTREADFPDGAKASLYVYVKEELEEVQASLNQYLTQFDVEVETEAQEDTAYASAGAGSEGSESADTDAQGDSTEALEAASGEAKSEADSESTADGTGAEASTRQVLRTRVQTVFLPLNLSIVDAQGDELSETGSMTIRLTLGDADLLSQLKQAKEEGVLRLYHRKRAQADSEDAKNAETESTEANLAEGTGNLDWEEVTFAIQENTEEADGYIEFTAESLSPFLFVKTEQVVTEVTADQTDAEDANGAEAEGEDSESENASDSDANAESESKEEAGDQKEEKIYPYFTSGLWGVKNSYEPIWEESDCLAFSRADFVSGKDDISVRFHTYLKGNPYDPEETDGEASDTGGSAAAGKDTGEKTAKAESSKTPNAKTQDADSTNLPQTLGVSEEESDSKTTSLSSDLKETIAYTLTDDTFYLEDKKLSDADYDIKGIEWIFGTSSSKATTGAESNAQEAALTQSSAQAVALAEGGDGSSSNLELWVGSSDRQTVTIWVRTSTNTNATTDTDEDDNNAENTQTTTWKVAAIYDLTSETYLSIDEALLTNIDGKTVSFADGVKGVRLTTKNKDTETYLGMYVDANLYPTDNVLDQLENAAEISLTNQTEASASKNETSLFQKINKTTVWLQDKEAQAVQTDAAAEVQAIAQTVAGGCIVTFDAGDEKFSTNESTNTVVYDVDGKKGYGTYEEPVGTAATFEGWYDAQTGGNKYDVDLDGNILTQLMGNVTLYAHYNESNFRWAVCIYGIGVDEMASGEAGLTFGPALGGNYIEATEENLGYISHNPQETDPGATTDAGNAYRCIHNDSWSTIVAWNEKDPYVYEQCIEKGCTHSVRLDENGTTNILNANHVYQETGDGVGAFVDEIVGAYIWSEDGTKKNWETSGIRAGLNGTSSGKYANGNCLLSTFPEELRNAIGSRKVKYYIDDRGWTDMSSVGYTYDKLWLYSVNEMIDRDAENGLGEYDRPLEGSVYPKWEGIGISATASRNAWYVENGGVQHIGGFALRSIAEDDYKVCLLVGFLNKSNSYALQTSMMGFTLARNSKESQGKYTVSFNAGNYQFSNNGNINVLKYDKQGEKVYGTYEEPKDTAATFEGWYDAQSDGTKYDIDLEGNISPVPTKDMTLYARYNESNYRYAVCIYGIEVDELAAGDAGLTFGPAMTYNYIDADENNQGYKDHDPTATEYQDVNGKPLKTAQGNEHRCIHNDSWSTIVAWNNKDPYVYEQCIKEGCTHSVRLNANGTTDILNGSFSYNVTGDGSGLLVDEINKNTFKWDMSDGNWAESPARAAFNGSSSGTTANGNCLLTTLPEELRNAIGLRVVKYSKNADDFTDPANVGVTLDKLWVFSPNELIDTSVEDVGGYDRPLEGSVYPKFSGVGYSGNNDLRNPYYIEGVPRHIGGYGTRSMYNDSKALTINVGSYYKVATGNQVFAWGFTLAKNAVSTLEVTFDAGSDNEFSGNTSTNTLVYSANGELLYGTYEEPEDTAASFEGWYDAKTGGKKYDIDLDGNISAELTGNLTLYAQYNESNYRYAVSVYGIGVDEMASGESGITFGPAMTYNYIVANAYKEHDPTAIEYQDSEGNPLKTALGNEHRCIHNDSWSTIVAWNEKDPYVYEQCIKEGCTHSVRLNANGTNDILNSNFTFEVTGDGSGALVSEVTRTYLKWTVATSNIENWKDSLLRAGLNGTKSGTVINDNCLLTTFPEELRNAIGSRVVKYSMNADDFTNPANVGVTYDKLWLFSVNELIDTSMESIGEYDRPLEGTVYPKFEGVGYTGNAQLRNPWFVYNNANDQWNGAYTLRSPFDADNNICLDVGNFYKAPIGGFYCGFTLARDSRESEAAYEVTFDANGELFSNNESTNIIRYNEAGEKVYGFYEEPVGTAGSFEGWYDAQSGGTKYDIDLEGNISPVPTKDITLYARYNESNYRYAVCIYGIEVDELAAGDAGLTFGPAMTYNYIDANENNQGYKDHDPTSTEYQDAHGEPLKTAKGNEHRCIHNDSWSTIVAWNEKDPYVYEQCIKEGCTHSVRLNANGTTDILNGSFSYNVTGDGAGLLVREIVGQTFLWKRSDGNWAVSSMRAALNGSNSGMTADGNCLLTTLPEELRNAIGLRVVKYSKNADDFTDPANVGVTLDKLWVFSPNELIDTSVEDVGGYDRPLEGSVYPKFSGIGYSGNAQLRNPWYLSSKYVAIDIGAYGTRSVYDDSTILSLNRGNYYQTSTNMAFLLGFTLAKSIKSTTLTISNTVEGNQGNKAKDFSYELQLTSASGNQISGEVAYTKVDFSGNTTTGTLSATNGVYAFSLAHGEYICFEGIPQNCSYEVSETANSSTGYKVTCDKPTGTLSANMRVAFTNTKNGAIPTLAVTGIGILLGLGLAAFTLLVIVRRKRRIQQ